MDAKWSSADRGQTSRQSDLKTRGQVADLPRWGDIGAEVMVRSVRRVWSRVRRHGAAASGLRRRPTRSSRAGSAHVQRTWPRRSGASEAAALHDAAVLQASKPEIAAVVRQLTAGTLKGWAPVRAEAAAVEVSTGLQVDNEVDARGYNPHRRKRARRCLRGDHAPERVETTHRLQVKRSVRQRPRWEGGPAVLAGPHVAAAVSRCGTGESKAAASHAMGRFSARMC